MEQIKLKSKMTTRELFNETVNKIDFHKRTGLPYPLITRYRNPEKYPKAQPNAERMKELILRYHGEHKFVCYPEIWVEIQNA